VKKIFCEKFSSKETFSEIRTSFSELFGDGTTVKLIIEMIECYANRIEDFPAKKLFPKLEKAFERFLEM
jgi:hypothetical protein